MKTVDKYLFKALDCYPYYLEEAIESLDYALSADPKNTMALWLYGRVYREQLQDYEMAKQYFQEAVANDVYAIFVYPNYLDVLLLNEDYNEAEQLIDFALTIKGIHKAGILLKKVSLLERRNDLKSALKLIKEIRIQATDNALESSLEEMETRLKSKKKLLKGKAETPEKDKKRRKTKKKIRKD